MTTESQRLRITIPAEHVRWFRKMVKEEMSTDGGEDWALSDDITRNEVIEINEKAARYIDLLDHIGWENDGGDAATAYVEASVAQHLIDTGLRSLGENMAVASGGYGDEPVLSEVKVVAARATWLAGVSELISSGERQVA